MKLVYSPLLRNEHRVANKFNPFLIPVKHYRARLIFTYILIKIGAIISKKNVLYVTNDTDIRICNITRWAVKNEFDTVFVQVSLFRHMPSSRAICSGINRYYMWRGFEKFSPKKSDKILKPLDFIPKIKIKYSVKLRYFIGQPGRVLKGENFDYYDLVIKFVVKNDLRYIKHPQEVQSDLEHIQDRCCSLKDVKSGHSFFTISSSLALQLTGKSEIFLLSCEEYDKEIYQTQLAIRAGSQSVNIVGVWV